MTMKSGQLKAATLEELEAAYESLPDRRSYYGQALAELIDEYRAQGVFRHGQPRERAQLLTPKEENSDAT